MGLHDDDVASLRSALTAEQEHRHAVETALEQSDRRIEHLRNRLDVARHERDEYRKAAEAADRIARDAIVERDEAVLHLKAARRAVTTNSPTDKLIAALGEIDRLTFLEKEYRIRALAAEATLKVLKGEHDAAAAEK